MLSSTVAATEDLSTVMDVFVREFFAHCGGGADSVTMTKRSLQKLIVKHLRPYLAGSNDPNEVLGIMGDLREDHGGSVDFQGFMATWMRVVVAGHTQFQEHVFSTKGPCCPATAALAK